MSNDKDILTTINTVDTDPGSFKLIIALGIAGLMSGLILVSTYLYTNPMIIANKEAAIKNAIFQVLPGCDSFDILELRENVLVKREVNEDKKEEDNTSQVIYAGYNAEGELTGFAIPGSQAGFQDIITAMFGYDAVKKIIVGFEVLESKETPGLGDKIFKDAEFQTNFSKLEVDPEILFVSKGEKTKDNEVEGITGATISSKAVVELLNKNLLVWKTQISEYLESNHVKSSEAHE